MAIGDLPSVVLKDGTFMLGNTQGWGSQVALLDAATLTWTFGGGDSDNEQGYVLLQTGDVLTANVYNPTSMRYDPGVKAFVQDLNLPVMLGAGSEIGPGITMMDGRVIWFGASGHTCIYTPGLEGENGEWTQGPELPTMNDGTQLVCNDSTAILEPNGKVFVVTWWGTGGAQNQGIVIFLEYDPFQNWPIGTCTPVEGAPNTTNREAAKMLLLPNGHGLVWVAEPTNVLYDLQFDSGAQASWAPTITSFPLTVACGRTVTLFGTQLCGLSECQHFGDDNQQSENYPMVRFISRSGETTYARAHHVSTRSIAPGQSGSVLVDIPDSLTPGTYFVEAVAMGLPSNRVAVDLVCPANLTTFQPVQVGNMAVYVLGSDGNLWFETGPFGGQIPPNRLQVDGNASAFQALDGNNVFVLGTDGNLWLETWPFGNVAETIQTRLQLDGNVSAFQAVVSGFGQKVFVLGKDGNLWWEPWPSGDVAQTIAERQIIDANVQAFQPLDVYDVIVLGGDGNLWFEGLPFGSIAQTIQNRRQIDANVKAFQPIDAYNIYVLGTDGTLWFEPWPVPTNSQSFDGWGNVQETIALRQIIDQNVAAFQAIDVNTVFVLGTDGNLWLETSPWGDVGQTIATRQPVDSGVATFYAWAAAHDFFGFWVVLVKDTNDNLWYETPPAPPQTSWRNFQIDGDVM